MGIRSSRRLRKFYWEQVAEIQKLLERYVKESAKGVDVEKYLLICEQTGQEPDPAKMPLSPSDFPEEVQVAFFMFSFLNDKWDGMSGAYMGKEWSSIEFIFRIHKISNPSVILYFMKMYEGLLIKERAEEADRRQKAEERKQNKSSGGGKQYTHNIRG